MKCRKITKILFAAGCCFLLMQQPSFPVAANTVPVSLFTSSSLRADDIRWVYKSIKGKRYKRLYNYAKHQWLTDWILIKG